MTGPHTIEEHLRARRDTGRKLLVPYLSGGLGDDWVQVVEAVAAAGADAVEIGIPFSDPVADGPVIAAAGHAAVASGAGLETAVDTVSTLRARGHQQPILAMGYLNPLLAPGFEDAVARLRAGGVDGLIVPDLPAGEERQLERLVAAAGLGIAFLVTPNTAPVRLEAAIRASTAFLYAVPLYGVTGQRERVAATTLPFLDRVRTTVASRLPVAVGFGVSLPEHVRRLAPAVDGIIVGSAIVAALDEGGPARVRALVADLARATEPRTA